MTFRYPVLAITFFFAVLPAMAVAQTLSQAESDPRTLGWIISRVSGMEFTELLSDRIWSRMGAEQDAYVTVDCFRLKWSPGYERGAARRTSRRPVTKH